MDTLTLVLVLIWTPLLLAYGASLFQRFRNKTKLNISKSKSNSLWHSMLR